MKMKNFFCLLACVSILLVPSKFFGQIQFTDLFQKSFSQSYNGLEKLKDAQTGKWIFDNASADFDVYEVKFDMDKGVHAMNFVKNEESLSSAQQMMVRYKMQVENLLPNEKYVLNASKSTKSKTVYEWKSSDKELIDKNPTIEINIGGDDNVGYMIISIIEPAVRKSNMKKGN